MKSRRRLLLLPPWLLLRGRDLGHSQLDVVSQSLLQIPDISKGLGTAEVVRTCCCFRRSQAAVENAGWRAYRGKLRRPLRGFGGDVGMEFGIGDGGLAACQSVDCRYRG